ncbi:branched-chain amino acid ABC transporter permease [Pseudacidovorax intermedius]|uniref:Amino acid/amide ABC transporter membrane protein 2 (HAAT family) n=1 Tax=Pseudacidovorax intermedius TaxID=433924 RepID=A0A370FD39_9BURK|nr:branched-chain amino acid ABC transporter permease [Pseudacidovorax intermedius]RDI22650.1 amino acid/amide ABC transporter membrane protein 2 (HAAT family) [Pseudacidovorax intermedius]
MTTPTRRFPLDAWALAVLAAVLCAIPFFASGYVLYVVNLLMVFVILALGMHVVIGEAGQFALSHTAFYGIGIYVAGLINTHWHPPFVLSILAGGLVSAALGYVIGLLALRMRDIYLALATFAFGEAMQWVFLNWESVTGGSNGMRMQPAQMLGLTLTNDLQAYPFVVGIAALMLGVTVWLSRSQFGSALRAVRESDVAAMAMGIDARAMKQSAFAVSAAFAGIAGGTYTLFISFIHPESLGFQTTILILTMVVVGGIGSVRGAVAGALAFGIISEMLRQALSIQEILYGAILLGFMMFRPRGLFADAKKRIARSHGQAAAGAAALKGGAA